MPRPVQAQSVSAKVKEQAANPGITARQRAEAAQALSHFLASTYVLYQKSLFYHWNVVGPHFVSLHHLFEDHYKELQEASDTIAERIRALGFAAPGTLAEFTAMSSIIEDKKLPSSAREMIANLLKGHELCSKEARDVLHVAEKSEDEVTHDLMIRRMEFHDKAAWMLRALQE